jgi:hypothetical protein
VAVKRPERLLQQFRFPAEDEENAPSRTSGETVR